jgi:hypothetical protein
MKYFRLAIVAAFFLGLVYVLHQCSSTDSSNTASDLGLTPAQLEAIKQGKTDGLPASLTPLLPPKPTTGS